MYYKIGKFMYKNSLTKNDIKFKNVKIIFKSLQNVKLILINDYSNV